MSENKNKKEVPKTIHLIQITTGSESDGHEYVWTPELARRKDMRPVEEEAMKATIEVLKQGEEIPVIGDAREAAGAKIEMIKAEIESRDAKPGPEQPVLEPEKPQVPVETAIDRPEITNKMKVADILAYAQNFFGIKLNPKDKQPKLLKTLKDLAENEKTKQQALKG